MTEIVKLLFRVASTLGPIFPCCWPEGSKCGCWKGHGEHDVGKAPLTNHGHKDATYDLAQIAHWWEKWPEANVGLALEEAGLFVVGPDSPEWAIEFKRRGLPPTVVVQTGGGEGHIHYYYRRPQNCPIYRNCRSGEYDIMTSGQTIVPPSLHRSGTSYRWLTPPWNVGDLPLAPQWAVDLLRDAMSASSTSPTSKETCDDLPPVRLDQVGMDWWNGDLVKKTAEGDLDRSATLYVIGTVLSKAGANPQIIAEALRERDSTLGYEKYADRKDDTEYWRIAQKVASARHSSDGNLPELQVITLSKVKTKAVYWLWKKRIPLGKQTVLGGDPGLGKSYLALDIAARVSHGGPLPPWDEGVNEREYAPKGDVLIISAEDGLEDTIRPRLERLGADMSRIHAISPLVRHGDKEVSLSLSDHLLQLEQAIVEHDAILLILDPVLAFTGKRDSHKSSDMRAVLGPLATVAERTGCAILSIIHLNKRSTEQKTIYRLMASLDIAASARSVMAVGADPNDPDKRVLAPVKMNLSTKPPSLGFHINEEHGFVWGGIVELDADTIIGAPTSIDDRSALDEGIDVLTEILSSGPLPAETVKQEAKEAGISDPTLRRAKASLGVKAVRVTEGNKGGGYWAWELPSQHDQEPRVQNDERLTEFEHLTDSQAQTEDLTSLEFVRRSTPHTQGKMATLRDDTLPRDHNDDLEEGRL